MMDWFGHKEGTSAGSYLSYSEHQPRFLVLWTILKLRLPLFIRAGHVVAKVRLEPTTLGG